jgi:hypothetical protein
VQRHNRKVIDFWGKTAEYNVLGFQVGGGIHQITDISKARRRFWLLQKLPLEPAWPAFPASV